jgi:hypothetical protein
VGDANVRACPALKQPILGTGKAGIHLCRLCPSSPLFFPSPHSPAVQQVIESHILKLFQSNLGPDDPE